MAEAIHAATAAARVHAAAIDRGAKRQRFMLRNREAARLDNTAA